MYHVISIKKFYFSNGLLILRRHCEDEGERADVGVLRKDHRPSIRRGGAFQTSKMHMDGEINNAFIEGNWLWWW
jgi:hypothetical protein